MSCTLVGSKWLHLNRKGRATFLNGLAECEIILNKGVPVLHSFAQALRRNAGTSKVAFDPTSGEHYRYMRELKTRMNVHTIVPITLEARLSYHRAFNCSPEQQVFYESLLDAWTFPLDGDIIEETYIDPVTWEDHRVWSTDRNLPTGNPKC